MCYYNRLIPNPKYLPNSKNNGIIPKPADQRVLVIPISCGQCLECRKKKARDWSVRLKESLRTEHQKTFITLTFSNESISKLYQDKDINNLTGYDLDNAAARLGVRRFLERWRKKHGKSIKHWLITELGHKGTENIHMHGIIWSKDKEAIEKAWKYGFVYHGKYVNEKTINYCTKYVTKIDVKHRGYKQKIFASAGIGAEYITNGRAITNQYNGIETRETYQCRTGHKIALPQYMRNKLYNDEERENLWLDKLDKNERYINGRKYYIRTEIEIEIWKKALTQAQYDNKKLGLGNGNHNWTLANYEIERRHYLQKKRILQAELKQWEQVFAESDAETEMANLIAPIEARSCTRSSQQPLAGVLPTIADRSYLGAPTIEEEYQQERINNMLNLTKQAR
ncbi:MAG: putative replication initiation protein [Microviridae sp.]|nr:MAG: putative replication initiation protein [Microviridae sp.]